MAQKDRRYTVDPEFTGHISGKKRFVLRFIGKRLSDHATRDEANKELARRKATGDHPPVVYHDVAAC